MANMIKFEIHKLFKSKSFYICSGLMLGLIIFFAMALNTSSGATSRMNGIEFALETKNMTLIEAILVIFICIFTCDDMSNGTIKNIYAKGYSRESVYFAKYIVVFITSLVLICFYILFSFVLGEILWSKSPDIVDSDMRILISQVIFVLERCTMYFAISIIFKRTGASIAISMVGIQVVEMAVFIIDMLIEKNNMFYQYLLNTMYDKVCYMDYNEEIFRKFVLFSVIYAIAFMVISFIVHKKRET